MIFDQRNDIFELFTPEVIDIFYRAMTQCNMELETESDNPKYMHGRDRTQHIRAKLLSILNRESLKHGNVDICNRLVKGFFLYGRLYLYFGKTDNPIKAGQKVYRDPKTIMELRTSFEAYNGNTLDSPLEPLFRSLKAEISALGMVWPVTHLYPVKVTYHIRNGRIVDLYFASHNHVQGQHRVSMAVSLLQLHSENYGHALQGESGSLQRRYHIQLRSDQGDEETNKEA